MKPGTHFRRFNQEWMWVQPADKLHHSGLIKSVSNDEKRGFAVNMQTGELTVLPYSAAGISVVLSITDRDDRYLHNFSDEQTLIYWLRSRLRNRLGEVTLQMESDSSIITQTWYCDRTLSIPRKVSHAFQELIRENEHEPPASSNTSIEVDVFNDEEEFIKTVSFKTRNNLLKYFKVVFEKMHVGRTLKLKLDSERVLQQSFSAETCWQVNLKLLENRLNLLLETFNEKLE